MESAAKNARREAHTKISTRIVVAPLSRRAESGVKS